MSGGVAGRSLRGVAGLCLLALALSVALPLLHPAALAAAGPCRSAESCGHSRDSGGAEHAAADCPLCLHFTHAAAFVPAPPACLPSLENSLRSAIVAPESRPDAAPIICADGRAPPRLA